MRSFRNNLFVFIALLLTLYAQGQNVADKSTAVKNTGDVSSKIVVVTGNRFSYKLIQKWIDDYNKVAPDVQIIIESRGTTDPAKYQILAEVYPQDEAFRKNREYINIGRYPVLPVATSNSAFAARFTDKGLTGDLIKQIFFRDIYAEADDQETIEEPFTIYTRLQKAGVPFVFANYFGFQQKDIKGTSIAGADEHLLKALLRDPNGVTYLPLTLIYDQTTRKPIDGLTVLPVDINGNKKLGDDEKIYADVDKVIESLEKKEAKDIKNIPLEYLHLSIDKQTATQEAIDFLAWVNENGQGYLHEYGYLLPEPKLFEKMKFNEFVAKRKAQ